jgi:hypothetical protein
MAEESWQITEEDWDKWLQANPRLAELEPALWFTTTKWRTFEIGWVEVKAND